MCLLVLGVYTYMFELSYAPLLPSHTYTYVTLAVAAIGLLALLTGVFGCCAVSKLSKCALVLVGDCGRVEGIP